MGKATYVTGLEYLSRRYNDNRMETVERREGFTRFDALLENGDKGRIDAYTLLPGIHLFYNDIPQGACDWNDKPSRVLQIEHCRQGSCELVFSGGWGAVCRQGDCAVHDHRVVKRRMQFAQARYVGITLAVEYDAGAATLAALHHVAGVDFKQLYARFAPQSNDERRLLFAPDAEMAALFESLYDVGGRAHVPRLRCKVLELLALLSATESPRWQAPSYTGRDGDAGLAKALALLGSNLSAPVRLEDAARTANLGATAFKERFARAFGISPAAYRRRCRMEEAARLLQESSFDVAAIAAHVGYRSPSKFAAAFRQAHAQSPTAYRKALRNAPTPPAS